MLRIYSCLHLEGQWYPVFITQTPYILNINNVVLLNSFNLSREVVNHLCFTSDRTANHYLRVNVAGPRAKVKLIGSSILVACVKITHHPTITIDFFRQL